MKLLAISFYRPPQLTPQAIQIGRLLYHLGTRTSLLCGAGRGRESGVDKGFDQYPDFADRMAQIIEVDAPKPLLKGKLFHAAMRWLPMYGESPDVYGKWRPLAVRAGMTAIAAGQVDVIASFGEPMSDHLVGLELKRRSGLPWVAHFSDPWSDNPYRSRKPLCVSANRWFEHQVIKNADRIVFTSRLTMELVMAKYPFSWRERTTVLPHAWDLTGVPQTHLSMLLSPPRKRMVIRHIGSCYGARSPEPLFRALKAIHAKAPAVLDLLCFEFYGHISPALLKTPTFLALPEGVVKIKGTVGYLESLSLMRDADALLSIDADSAGQSVFLPSKLVDYIGAAKPVLGITPQGTAATLIAEWGGLSASPGDTDGISRNLIRFVQAWQGKGPRAYMPNDYVRNRFAPAIVASQLRDLLADLSVAQDELPARANHVHASL